jgi:hypothetical protein
MTAQRTQVDLHPGQKQQEGQPEDGQYLDR